MEKLEQFSDILPQLIMEYGSKVIGAILVWLIGSWMIRLLVRMLRKILEKGGSEASLRTFFVSLTSIGLKILLAISVLGMLGIEMTSFIALLGAAGLAVGMALSGTLQNFAGGIVILIFKPFKVGDLIESQGQKGTVKEIQIFVTVLTSPELHTIILPNGALSNNELTNYTTEGILRVDLEFGISYDNSIEKAKKVLLEVMEQHPKVVADPPPFIGVSSLGDSSVNLAVRPHCKPEDYWEVYFDVYEQGKNSLDAHQIEIPFPQRVVHQKNT